MGRGLKGEKTLFFHVTPYEEGNYREIRR